MSPAVAQQNALQVGYFTREVPGYEVEAKYTITDMEPWLNLCQMAYDISLGLWMPYIRQKAMGSMSTETRYLDLTVEFWGSKDDLGGWRQLAMCIKNPWQQDRYMVVFKDNGHVLRTGQYTDMVFGPLIRREESRYQWMEKSEAIALMMSNNAKAQPIGVVHRQKYSLYITNQQSYRNYCLSCDLCYANGHKLSQLELEYKGRNGLWYVYPEFARAEIVHEYEQLHALMVSRYSRSIISTSLTKFDWLLSIEHN